MRDALIEAIAKARHENWGGGDPWPCEFCLARTEDIMDGGWPVIVEFVAEWLAEKQRIAYDEARTAETYPESWREEMSVRDA